MVPCTLPTGTPVTYGRLFAGHRLAVAHSTPEPISRAQRFPQNSTALPAVRAKASNERRDSSPHAAASGPEEPPEGGRKRAAASSPAAQPPRRGRQRVSEPKPGPWKRKPRRDPMAGPDDWDLFSPTREHVPCQRHQQEPAGAAEQVEAAADCQPEEIDPAVGADCLHARCSSARLASAASSVLGPVRS